MNTDSLYSALKEKGLYSKSLEEFNTQFSDEFKQADLYSALTERKLYTKSFDDFSNQFFKKKDQPISEPSSEDSEDGTNLPSAIERAAFGTSAGEIREVAANRINDWRRGWTGLKTNRALNRLMQTEDRQSATGATSIKAPTMAEKAELIDKIVDLQNQMQTIPKSASRKELDAELAEIQSSDSDGYNKFLSTVGAIVSSGGGQASLITESLASQAPFMPIAVAAGALTGGSAWAMAFGAGLSSMSAESQLSIIEGIRHAGLDPSKADDLVKLAEDTEMQNKVSQFATTRGVALGAVEGIFSMVGVKGLSKIGSKALRIPSQFVSETIGEGSGEAAAQVATTGEINPVEVAAEAFTNVGRSAAQVVTTETYGAFGRELSRQDTEKLIEGAQTEEEAAGISVPESDERLSKKLEEKQQELEQSKDDGPQESEESTEPVAESEPEATDADGEIESGTSESDSRPAVDDLQGEKEPTESTDTVSGEDRETGEQSEEVREFIYPSPKLIKGEKVTIKNTDTDGVEHIDEVDALEVQNRVKKELSVLESLKECIRG